MSYRHRHQFLLIKNKLTAGSGFLTHQKRYLNYRGVFGSKTIQE